MISFSFDFKVCLTSNIGNGFKVRSYDEHPVKIFEKHGIPFSFCMDNWLLSGDLRHQPDPNKELIIGSKLLGWNCVKKALINGVKAAFSPSIDDEWMQNYVSKLDELFHP